MRTLPFIGSVLGLSVAIGAQSPQQPNDRAPILTARTDLVTLSVTVVDRRGRLVGGLRSQDFSIYDEGEGRAIEFFTNDDLPATIGLVIDSSGSMRTRRAQVTAAAAAFAAMSHPLNEHLWSGLPPTVPFTGDREQLRAALAAAPALGMTALYDAVDRALTHLALGTRDRKALIVVADGGDNASASTREAVVDHARRADAAIYGVAIFDPHDREAGPGVLKTLARETGGHAYAPDRADEVMEAFAQIAREIRSGYTIAFLPPDAVEGYRSLRVVADAGDGRELVVRTRAGYYAGPSRPSAR
jgi:Ca-activated chloride channel family protein